MGIVNCCFQKIGDEATDWTIKGATREVGYLIYYKENVEALEDEMGKLEIIHTENEVKVHTARIDGVEILEAVTKWLTSVEEIKEEVKLFLQDKNKDYKECCKVSCPNLCSRFRLGRGANKKLAVVTQLIEDGKQFAIVAHPLPPTDYVEALKDKMKNLIVRHVSTEERVRTDENNGREILDPVREWLTSVEEMKKEVDLFLQDNNKEYIKCCEVLCPDSCSSCQLGREAKKKLAVVTQLIEDCKQFSTVSNHPTPPPYIGLANTDDYENFGTRKLVFEKILKALSDDAVSVVGVWGMPGVGKSTIVREVGKHVKKEQLFNEVAIADVSENVDVRNIQGQLADCLHLDVSKSQDVKGRAGELENRLKNQKNEENEKNQKNQTKILVILDDVWRKLELTNIGINFGDATIKARCKILLSSRTQSVCKDNKCPNPILIDVLDKTEAWNLFKQKAGSCVDDCAIHSIAKDLFGKCGELPLIIRAVGAALKDKEKCVWEDARNQLMNFALENIGGIDRLVCTSFKLSFNQLTQEDAKSCFLLCSLFPGEISIEDLVRHAKAMGYLRNMELNDARNRVRTMVTILKSSSLLLDGRDDNSVKMHDVIRAVAVSIASKEDKYAFQVPKIGVSKWPETDQVCKVISLSSENIRELPDTLNCPELHTLILECSNESLQVPDTFFNGLKKLKVLNLSRMSILSLPSSLVDLADLQMLCLTNCKLEDISILEKLKKLEILSLRDCNIEMLPPEIRQLTHLRLLDLRDCDSLKVIPPQVLSNLSSLEELYFPRKFDNWEVEATNQEIRSNHSILDELSSLIGLTSIELHASNGKIFHDDELCKRLTRFKISVGGHFGYWENWRSTKTLKLVGISVEKVGLKILMKKAEVLDLHSLKGLQKFFHESDGEAFVHSKYLRIWNCSDVEHLAGQRIFSNLCELEVHNCGFKYLFSVSIARCFVKLQRLGISYCKIVEEIVKNESEGQYEENMSPIIFPQLKYLKLSSLPCLRSFYPKMRMTSSTNENPSPPPQSLFNAKVAMPALEEMHIHRCEGLKYVFSPSVARKLESLQKLYIFDCERMEGIIGEMGKGREEIHNEIVFPQLKHLRLNKLRNLKSFWSCGSEKEMSDEVEPAITRSQYFFKHKVAMPALEEMHIDSCEGCKYVFSPSVARKLESLQELSIKNCEEMEGIIGEMVKGREEIHNEIVFPQLKHLRLNKLRNLKSFWSWGSEKEMSDEVEPAITRSQYFFNHKVAMPALEAMAIDSCEGLKYVFSPSVARTLERLKTLSISDCEEMEGIIGEMGKGREEIHNEIVFPQLKYLTLARLRNLKSFWSCGSEKEMSDEVEEPAITRSQYFFKHKVGMPALENMRIFVCKGLKYVFSPSAARTLERLETLSIFDCEEMEGIIWEMGNGREEIHNEIVFPQLKYLTLARLRNLKSFWSCGSEKEMSDEVEEPAITQSQYFFKHKVAMPALEDMSISICKGLKYVFSPSAARTLERLETLSIFDCEEMEGIIWEMGNGREEIHNEIVFPQLKHLALTKLRNLKSFWSCGSEKEMSDEDEPAITRSQYFFKHKVLFPSLEKLKLSYLIINSTVVSPYLLRRLQNLEELDIKECGEVTELFDLEGLKVGDGENGGLLSKLSVLKLNDLPKLNCLWSKDPHGILCFQSLKRVEIVNCGLLRNVFTCSVAGTLEHLRDLQIESCGMMEEIIGNEEGTATTSVGCEILFPKLVDLSLFNLPKLTSFCSANDYTFNMPSLKRVMLGGCPQMQIFTCGQISMPMMEIKYPRSVQSCGFTDLNNCVQQHVFNGKGLAMVFNDYDYDSEEDREVTMYFESDDDGKHPDNQTPNDDDDNDDGGTDNDK